MRPSHSEKRFSASRIFTDREDAQRAFLSAVETPQGPGDYRVLNWFGVGGQGKTALCRELQRLLKTMGAERGRPFRHLGWATLDFESQSLRHLEEAMLSLRLQLAATGGGRYPAFDVAFARYFALVNPGADMRKRHPELFRGESEILDDMLDWSEAGVEAVTTAASVFLPGVNILYKYGARLAGRVREWWEQRGKTVLQGLDDLTADQVRQRLPTYLGADLCDLLVSRPETRLVVFLDTYEALWRDRARGRGLTSFRVDEWVRLLVRESPGVLFAVFGRDALTWMEQDSEWSDIIERHLLGVLSEDDARSFLKAVPIREPEIETRIARGARGLPFFLDLQVDIYEDVINAGGSPTREQFGGSQPQILARFLDHLSDSEQQLLRLASYPKMLDERVMLSLTERFLGGSAQLDWQSFCSWSFVSNAADGRAVIHSIMRDELQSADARQRPGLFKDVHGHLASFFDGLGQTGRLEELDAENDSLFAAAAEHLLLSKPDEFPGWVRQKWESRWAARRLGALRGALESAFDKEPVADAWPVEDQADLLARLGKVYNAMGFSSRECFERAVELHEGHDFSAGHTDITELLHLLASSLGLAEVDRRVELAQRAIASYDGSRSASLPSVIECECLLAEIARSRGDLNSTRSHYERALALLEAQGDGDGDGAAQPSGDEVKRLNMMGMISMFLEEHKKSQELFRVALRHADAVLGPLHYETIEIADHYAAMVLLRGEAAGGREASAFIEGRLEELRRLSGEFHPTMLDYLDTLVRIRRMEGDFGGAEELLGTCREMATQIYGPGSSRVTSYELSLLDIVLRRGEFEAVIERVGQIDIARLDDVKTISLYAKAVSLLTAAYLNTGRLAEAKEYADKGLERLDSLSLSRTFSCAEEYIDLLQYRGGVYFKLGDNEAALRDSAKALTVMEEMGHPVPMNLAVRYGIHAQVLEALGKPPEAVEHYRKAIAIIEANYPEPSKSLLTYMERLGDCLNGLGLFGEAASVRRRLVAYGEAGAPLTPQEVVNSYLKLMASAALAGEFEMAEAAVEPARRWVRTGLGDDPASHAMITAAHADSLMKAREPMRAQRMAEELCRQYAEDVEHDALYSRAEGVLIETLMLRGRSSEAEQLARKRLVRREADTSLHRGIVLETRLLVIRSLVSGATAGEARAMCDEELAWIRGAEGQPEGQSDRLRYLRWNLLTYRADALINMGEVAAAAGDLHQVLTEMKEYSDVAPIWYANVGIRLAWLRGLAGDWPRATSLSRKILAAGRRAFRAADSSQPNTLEIPFLGMLGWSLYGAGEVEEALGLARSALVIVEQSTAQTLAWDSAVYAVDVVTRELVREGRAPEALKILGEACAASRSPERESSFSLARHLLTSACVRAQTGDTATARAEAEQALAIVTACYGERHPVASKAREVLASLDQST